MKIGERIKERRKNLGLTQKQVAKEAAITASAVTQWELGSTKPSGENLYALCHVLKCQPDWLLYGKDDPKSEANLKRAAEKIESWYNTSELRDDEVELPFFTEVEPSDGSKIYAVKENHGAKLKFKRSRLKKCGVAPNDAACVNISGTSMWPVLPDGAIVAIDTASTSVKDGKMYALEYGGMLRVKLVYHIPFGGLRLRSFNRDEYPDEVYDSEDVKNIHVIGRVFWYSVLI